MKRKVKMYLVGIEENASELSLIKEYNETDFEEYGWFFERIITGRYPSKVGVFSSLPQWVELSEELKKKVGNADGITMVTELDNFKFRNFWRAITKNIETLNEFFNENPVGIRGYTDAFIECQLDYNRSYNKILHDLLNVDLRRTISLLWKYE